MVMLWPWRSDSVSTASFAKTLSTQSTKIAETQGQLERLRLRARRFMILATLYVTFAYTVYIIVLLLVVGYRNFGTLEWTGAAGGPVLIFSVRATIRAYYSYRIQSVEARLKRLQDERAKIVRKLKDATKFDTTAELIEKYGGGDGVHGTGKIPASAKESDRPEQMNLRMRGKSMPDRKDTRPLAAVTQIPHGPQQYSTFGPSLPTPASSPNSLVPGEEFAANAFTGASYSSPSSISEHHWYDRIFDVLLGEDESAPKNRIVLLCQSCRLVNGQAPPGTSLTELGAWKCMACGALNGQANDAKGNLRDSIDDTQEDNLAYIDAMSSPSSDKDEATSEEDSNAHD